MQEKLENGVFLYNCKFYHPRIEVLQNCVSFSHEGTSERIERKFKKNIIRTIVDLKFRCVKCLPLKKVLKTSSQAPMSNLRVHLRKIHPDTMAEFDELVKTLPKRPRKPKAPTEFSFNRDKSKKIIDVNKPYKVRKNHTCEVCGKCFRQKSYLESHKRGVHEG